MSNKCLETVRLSYLPIFITNIILLTIIWKAKACPNCSSRQLNEDIVGVRIVGGTSKYIQEYSFVVGLAHATDDKKQHFVCGGSIVSKRWAISAYHCLNYFWNLNLFAEDMYLVGNATAWENGVVHRVEKYITNKKVKRPQDFDVFLLKVVEPFSGLYETPIIVARNDYIYRPKRTVTVVGWGLTKAENILPEKILRGVKLVLYSDQECKQIFHHLQSGEKYEITDRMLCAGPGQIFEKSDACQMDSGGPLVDGDLLIGIVSWGAECGKGYPGIYARVSQFEAWIHSVEKAQKESIAKFKNTPFK